MTSSNRQIGTLAGDLKRLRRGFEAGYRGLRQRIDALAGPCKMNIDRETLERCRLLAEAIKARRRAIKKYLQDIDEIHRKIEAVVGAAARETRRQHGNAVAGFVSALLNLLPLARTAHAVERVLRALGDLASAVAELGGIDRRIRRDMQRIESARVFIRNRERDREREQRNLDRDFRKWRDLGCSDAGFGMNFGHRRGL